jgi:hypothetical protein
MTPLVQTSDYKNFLDLLIQQYLEKPKFKGILEAVGNQCNNIETAIFELIDEYNIENGSGIQLDIIGKILGLNRDGRSDESYKTLLKIKAEINFSSGTPEAIIKTAQKLYNATDVQIAFVYPAKVQLWQNGDIGIFLEYDMELDVPGDLMLLDDGGTMILWQADDIAEDLIYQVLPSGVDLLLASNLILDDGGFMELDDTEFMIVT